jgi:hypothetical protein
MKAEPAIAAGSVAPAPAARRLPPWAAWTIGIACIVAAWLVALVTPGEEQAQAPFEVPAVIGEPAAGRNLVVTVTDIRRASEVSAGGWTAEGNWLVVDLDAEAVLTESGARLHHTDLRVDGTLFSASDRPDSLAENGDLAVGIPIEGSLAFELPDGLDSGAGRIELALNSDPALDSMIVLTFDLGEVPTVEKTELLTTGWANP